MASQGIGQLLELVRMTAFEECIGTLLKIDAFGAHERHQGISRTRRWVVKLPVCGSKIRRILRTQMTVTSRCSGTLRSRTRSGENGINGGDPRSGEEAVYAGFAHP